MFVELVAQELQLLVLLEVSLEEPHHQVVDLQQVVHVGHTEHPAKNPNWNPKHQAQSSSSRRSHRSTIHSHRAPQKRGRPH